MMTAMIGCERLQPCSLGAALASTRRLRGMKQSHIAELLQVTQSTAILDNAPARIELYPGVLEHEYLALYD